MRLFLIVTISALGFIFYQAARLEAEQVTKFIALQSLTRDVDVLQESSEKFLESLLESEIKKGNIHPDESDREKLQKLLDESI